MFDKIKSKIIIKNLKIGNKVALLFLVLGILELSITYKPLTLLIFNSFHISKDYIVLFEVITVPLTVYILSLYILQKASLPWTYLKMFSIGYLVALSYSGMAFLEDLLLPHGNIIEQILKFFSFINIIAQPFLEISHFLTSFTTWSGWSLLFLSVYLYAFAIFPVILGIIFMAIYYIFKVLTNKKVKKLNPL